MNGSTAKIVLSRLDYFCEPAAPLCSEPDVGVE